MLALCCSPGWEKHSGSIEIEIGNVFQAERNDSWFVKIAVAVTYTDGLELLVSANIPECYLGQMITGSLLKND